MSLPGATKVTAPTGEVTLVFTDIQGSTRLWDRAPAAMQAALDLHNAELRRVVRAHGGYEVKTEGDAFMVAFHDPLSAVRMCLEAQVALLAAPWSEEILSLDGAAVERAANEEPVHRGLRVRMGVHVGDPECRIDPVTGRMDYFGPTVNRAARIGAAGHGGQIVLSESVLRRIEPHVAALGSPEVTDLGEHLLKDLERPERIFQILPATVAGRRFPPLRSQDVRRTNLPPETTDFIGREGDLHALAGRIAAGARLVTLMGPGGTGKTRLSMRYAALHLDEYSRGGGGGAWFCDLTEARDLDGVCAAVGRALEVPLTSGRTANDAADQLGHAIAGRGRVLILLDNFEQVVSLAGETVGRWLANAPAAVFLVSSQERLRLPGEETYELKPLPVPGEGEAGLGSEAAQLFVRRARAVRPGFEPAEADGAAIAEIVRQLDGIPLAIELAAARMGVLSAQKLLERLPRRFDLLGGARRDATSRQATLRGAIDWSWNLLQPHEQDALAQCSVFAGGFGLEAAEEVLDLSAHEGAPWPMDVIESLRDKSLLRAWEPEDFPGELRFGMYSNIREYAAEKLAKAGSGEAVRGRHAAYHLRVGEAWVEELDVAGGLERMRRLVLERENLAAVFRDSVGRTPVTPQSASDALRAIRVLDSVMASRGPFGLHLEWLDAALAAAEGVAVDPLLRARVLDLRGGARRMRGRAPEAIEDFEHALAIARENGAAAEEARSLGGLALTHHTQARVKEARRIASAAVEVALAAGLQRQKAFLDGTLGVLAMEAGDEEEAAARMQEALRGHRQAGNRRFEAVLLNNLGILHRRRGALAEARTHYEQALAIFREFGERRFEGGALGSMAGVLMEEGKLEEAAVWYDRAIAQIRETGNRRALAIFAGNKGILELLVGRIEAARLLLDEAVSICRELEDRSHEGLYLSFLGAAEQEAGRAEAASVALAAAAAAAEGSDAFEHVVRILQRTADAIAAARGDVAAAARVDATVREARTPGADGRSPADRSEDVRLALRVVERLRSA